MGRKSLNTTIVQRTKQKSRNKSVRKPKHNPPHKSMAPQNGMRLEKTLDPRLDPAAIRITEVERKRPDFTSRRRKDDDGGDRNQRTLLGRDVRWHHRLNP